MVPSSAIVTALNSSSTRIRPDAISTDVPSFFNFTASARRFYQEAGDQQLLGANSAFCFEKIVLLPFIENSLALHTSRIQKGYIEVILTFHCLSFKKN